MTFSESKQCASRRQITYSYYLINFPLFNFIRNSISTESVSGILREVHQQRDAQSDNVIYFMCGSLQTLRSDGAKLPRRRYSTKCPYCPALAAVPGVGTNEHKSARDSVSAISFRECDKHSLGIRPGVENNVGIRTKGNLPHWIITDSVISEYS